MTLLPRLATLPALAAVLILAGPVDAQDNKEPVKFTTVDEVSLKGTFYPGTKGKNSPTVLCIHKFGSDRTKGDWHALAVSLQKKGYSVLCFDLRGHGESTEVENNTFWDRNRFPQNTVKFIKGASPKRQLISYKEFSPAYFPYLVNDITAARMFLDRKNDAHECNTSSIFVIGAEDGAALALFWATTEYQRLTNPPKTGALGIPMGGSTRKGGPDIAGIVCLSAVSQPLGLRTFSIANMLAKSPEVRDRVHVWFAAGKDDTRGVNEANFLYEKVFLANNAKLNPLPKLTNKKVIDGTKLAGAELLGLPKTQEMIEQYFEAVIDKRANVVWELREAAGVAPYPVPVESFLK